MPEARGELTLVVLAAGLGSRFGGDKAFAPVGPGGETLFDYSVFDAARAGFERLVLVVPAGTDQALRNAVSRRYRGCLSVDFVEQRLTDLPPGWAPPEARTKPWGTAHAVLLASAEIGGPFAAANADDFYGSESWRRLGGAIRGAKEGEGALVAYRLRDTMPERGAVSRAVCQRASSGRLRSLVEVQEIERHGGGFRGVAPGGPIDLSGDEWISMNLWGFAPGVREGLLLEFERFLGECAASVTAEYLLPAAVDALMRGARLGVSVLEAEGPWLGITRRSDVPQVSARLQDLVASGIYPCPLFSPGD